MASNKEGTPLRRGPVTHITLNQEPPVKKRGQRLIFNKLTGEFEPEKLPVRVVAAPATPQAVQGTPTGQAQVKRKSRKRSPRPSDPPVPLEDLKWLTVRQTHLRFRTYSEKALRHLVAQAEAYQKFPKAGLRSNGLIDCILRPAGARKILIDAEKFEQWLRDSAVSHK